jgi:hypothetical protein
MRSKVPRLVEMINSRGKVDMMDSSYMIVKWSLRLELVVGGHQNH